jgi:hypothetical protein
MKMVKSLILGSAAGLLAMSGAQAADLPVKAKAVEYVRICSLYGAGFWYIPGTDTCIKLGGYLRIDTTFNSSTVYDAPAYSGDSGQQNRYRDYFIGRSRMALTVDTRTATEYGVVRTFAQGDFQFQQYGTANNAVLSGAPTAPGGFNNALLSSAGGGYVAVEMVFLQFAGFTFGKSASAYATPWHGYPGNNTSFLIGGHDTVTGVQNIQYSAQFGNGVSATIGLDDPTQFNRTSLYNLSVGLSATGASAFAYGGTHAPDIVGNVRIDQAWGLLQFSAAAHLVNASYNVLAAGTGFPTALSEISGHPDDKWGGSVMGALQIKNIPTGAGDDIKLDASWSKGDVKNVISTSGATPNFAMFNGSNRGYNGIGFGVSADGIFLPGLVPDIHLTTAYGVRGAFNHNWDPYWSSSLFGAAAAVRYDGTAKAAYCLVYAVSNPGAKSADYSCNPDYNVFMVGAVTRWTPVKNLTFSAEVLYFRLDQKFTGTSVLAVAAPKPTTVYEYKDQDTVSFNVRAQRNF